MTDGYVIYSKSEHGYWSNEAGWGSLETAATYPKPDGGPLPISAKGDAEWLDGERLGSCDECDVPYDVASNTDHDATSGYCWEHSPRLRIDLQHVGEYIFADGQSYFLHVTVPRRLYFGAQVRFVRWPPSKVDGYPKPQPPDVLCFRTEDEGYIYVDPDDVTFVSHHKQEDR